MHRKRVHGRLLRGKGWRVGLLVRLGAPIVTIIALHLGFHPFPRLASIDINNIRSRRPVLNQRFCSYPVATRPASSGHCRHRRRQNVLWVQACPVALVAGRPIHLALMDLYIVATQPSILPYATGRATRGSSVEGGERRGFAKAHTVVWFRLDGYGVGRAI